MLEHHVRAHDDRRSGPAMRPEHLRSRIEQALAERRPDLGD
jgi:hypothetical protein